MAEPVTNPNTSTVAEPSTGIDEKGPWTYAFVIMVLLSLLMLALRSSGKSFLALDFEATLIYFPTLLSGIITLLVSARHPN